MSKGTWPRTEVPAEQGILPALHSRQPLSLLLPRPPCTAPQPLTTPVSNSYKREPKLQQSAASVGSMIPPTSAEGDRGVRAGDREHQWPHCAEHISLPSEAPSLQLVPLGRELEKPGDTSFTWSTVQLFPCLAAVVGLHLCPLAKEGETDMTCSTRVRSRKVRTRLGALVVA